jgi:trans-aconitate 2-methyltransferase
MSAGDRDSDDKDWNPGTYERFRDLRLRPALDLLAQVPELPPGQIVDLGCGAGAAGPALRVRFPQAQLLGLDASAAMLARATAAGVYNALLLCDIGGWRPKEPIALIFSNAALHWLDDHDRLLPRLAGFLAPGGALAVQMPRNFDAPSHVLLRELSAKLFPDRFPCKPYRAPVYPARDYLKTLSPLGTVDAWETEYLQRLPPPRRDIPCAPSPKARRCAPSLTGYPKPKRKL